LGGTDPDGDALTFVVDSGPSHGALTGTPPRITYTSDAGFVGRDSFTYRATDGTAVSPPATVTVDVLAGRPPNRAPTVALAPAGPVDEGAPLTLTTAAADPDGDVLTYSWTTDVGTIESRGAEAVLNVDDGPAVAHVRVTVTDSAGASASAAADVRVTNVAPTASASASPLPQFWGLPVQFDGTGSDVSAADVAAGLAPSWSFGDDASATTAHAVHTYARPGTYGAAFAVRDKDGAVGSSSID